MRYLIGYNLNGLTEEDAITLCKDKRDAALKKLNAAREEFEEWDSEYTRRQGEHQRRWFSRMIFS